MDPHVLSTNLAHPQPDPGGADRVSGIDKRPVGELELFTPGPAYGDGPGVRGDVVGDSQHHGGAQKAVYAYAREELDHWEGELGRELACGAFGENLTTTGIDLEALVVNQPLRIGTALLEVSVPRRPCRTFAAWLDERGWLKRFTARGRCGTYLRVVEPGVVRAGDRIELGRAPVHGVTMRTAFAGAMGDLEASRALVEAACLPSMYHQRHVEALARRG
ncbi:MOSC domain-containing protein [Kytococcus sp. HMSC28H12]|uniref:MOSC domain-containing protein n=1 Tax=Kytococcus TaxID=57499 RepID=UPI0008A13027|nr:MOSC domain-containing protein [Kytococcus sp. HMSC28H12]OFS14592.1 molybdenum cofactor biosysynthesis protein [Kytococcus sp. HMSC28H12]